MFRVHEDELKGNREDHQGGRKCHTTKQKLTPGQSSVCKKTVGIRGGGGGSSGNGRIFQERAKFTLL